MAPTLPSSAASSKDSRREEEMTENESAADLGSRKLNDSQKSYDDRSVDNNNKNMARPAVAKQGQNQQENQDHSVEKGATDRRDMGSPNNSDDERSVENHQEGNIMAAAAGRVNNNNDDAPVNQQDNPADNQVAQNREVIDLVDSDNSSLDDVPLAKLRVAFRVTDSDHSEDGKKSRAVPNVKMEFDLSFAENRKNRPFASLMLARESNKSSSDVDACNKEPVLDSKMPAKDSRGNYLDESVASKMSARESNKSSSDADACNKELVLDSKMPAKDSRGNYLDESVASKMLSRESNKSTSDVDACNKEPVLDSKMPAKNSRGNYLDKSVANDCKKSPAPSTMLAKDVHNSDSEQTDGDHSKISPKKSTTSGKDGHKSDSEQSAVNDRHKSSEDSKMPFKEVRKKDSDESNAERRKGSPAEPAKDHHKSDSEQSSVGSKMPAARSDSKQSGVDDSSKSPETSNLQPEEDQEHLGEASGVSKIPAHENQKNESDSLSQSPGATKSSPEDDEETYSDQSTPADRKLSPEESKSPLDDDEDTDSEQEHGPVKSGKGFWPKTWRESDADLEDRVTVDGCILPHPTYSFLKRNADGTFHRPPGRCVAGTIWDAHRGVFVPKQSKAGIHSNNAALSRRDKNVSNDEETDSEESTAADLKLPPEESESPTADDEESDSVQSIAEHVKLLPKFSKQKTTRTAHPKWHKTDDGSIHPDALKKNADGTYTCPPGGPRPTGMVWDAHRGVFAPKRKSDGSILAAEEGSSTAYPSGERSDEIAKNSYRPSEIKTKKKKRRKWGKRKLVVSNRRKETGKRARWSKKEKRKRQKRLEEDAITFSSSEESDHEARASKRANTSSHGESGSPSYSVLSTKSQASSAESVLVSASSKATSAAQSIGKEGKSGFEIGSRVYAEWENGQYYWATVVDVKKKLRSSHDQYSVRTPVFTLFYCQKYGGLSPFHHSFTMTTETILNTCRETKSLMRAYTEICSRIPIRPLIYFRLIVTRLKSFLVLASPIPQPLP